jgi:hypothetical protein
MTCLTQCATSEVDRERGQRCLVACWGGLEKGAKVKTPTGRRGTVIEPPGLLPLHCLIDFGDRCWWMLAEILELATEEEPPKTAKRKRKAIEGRL